MSPIRCIAILSYVLLLAQTTHAQEHQLGVFAGTAFLYGDNTTSNAGPSLGLTYDMLFNPVLSIGAEGVYQRISGETQIDDPTSIFYGQHDFDTTFLMLGLHGRVTIPTRIAQPYLLLGAGATLWFPGEKGNIRSLPLKRNISRSVDPYASLGIGTVFQVGRNWSIDIGAKGHYFFNDELDNVDGQYVSGTSSMNDYTLRMGLTISYVFGQRTEPVREYVPERIHFEPEPSTPREELPEETTPLPDDSRNVIEDTPVFEPEEPETGREIEDRGAETDIEEDMQAIPYSEPVIPYSEPTPTLPPPVIIEQPSEPIRPPVRPQQIITDAFFVHVASFPSLDEANTKADELNRRAYRTRVSSINRGELGTWYRVFVGPYTTRRLAERTAELLIEIGLSDYAAVIELNE